ncbi:MAG: thermitase [Patiriisocius sp.]|jgi:subtilisin family serine protease/subtilisin-like proprotein convertase family protein
MKYNYRVNNCEVMLEADENLLAIRFKEPAKHSMRSRVSARNGLGQFKERLEIPAEKYTILPVDKSTTESYQSALSSLAHETDVARVAAVFTLGENKVLATERLLVGFKANAGDVLALFNKYKLTVIEKKWDEYIVQADESVDPIEIAEKLAKEDVVDYAEPDFVAIGSHISRRTTTFPEPAAGDPRSNDQYAIRITKAIEAWNLQQGDQNITIAVLDEGVDVYHEDLIDTIVGSYDGVDDDTFQEPNDWDGHGTACAGLAAATHNNNLGIKGVGGGCSIHAVRIAYSDSPGANWVTRNSWIARAIDWSWQNGASVLSNSWGGGAPSTAIINAFERARTQGRQGKGCVLVVAAGNASGAVDFPGELDTVLTVSASNEYDEFKTKTSSDGETWWGSNFGSPVDLAAPGVHNLTTDISGDSGYTDNNYTDFNGTSSATPIVAGAAALLLSAEPELTELEVRNRLKQTADKVGAQPYVNGRNDQFGYGRLNVFAALQGSSQPPVLTNYVTIHKVLQDVLVKDQETSRVIVAVGDAGQVADLKVHIEIEHTYVGDLLVKLIPPAGSALQAILLHDRTGGGQDDLVNIFDSVNTPELASYIGKSLQGNWALEVSDSANQDEGKIVSLSLELSY